MNMKNMIQRMTDLENTQQLNESSTTEACSSMPAPEIDKGSPVSVNVSMNATGKEHVEDLLDMMKQAGLSGAQQVQPEMMPMRTDMERLRDVVDGPTTKMLAPEEEDMEEDYANAPDEQYDDHETMIHDLSGGINKKKDSYAAAEPGDNAMAVEDIQSALYAALSEKKAKPDYIDLDDDGDTEEPMKKAAKDKEMDEEKKKGVDGKACWDGYRYAGREKKADGTYKDKCVKVKDSQYSENQTAKKKDKEVDEAAPNNNPVAKNAGKFNKAQVQTDRKKEQKKGKSVKHKGRDMAMESPVFDTYVKPFLDKSPKQIIEFYDSQARTIIDRLSRERTNLAEANTSTKLHDVIIARLRENLDAAPEQTTNEISRRGYRRPSRSSFDIGRTGYGDGRGGNLGSDKAAFKRREMEVELGDEPDNNYAVFIDKKIWKVFKSQRQAEKAAATIRSKYNKDASVALTALPPSP